MVIARWITGGFRLGSWLVLGLGVQLGLEGMLEIRLQVVKGRVAVIDL